MLEFFSTKKIATPVSGDMISLDDTERQIFAFLREACSYMPKKPVLRIAGGWCRDKLLGKPSDDIDISIDTMDGKEFGGMLYSLSKSPDMMQKFGPNIASTPKDTEENDANLKKMAPSFIYIHGQKIDLIPLRGIEIYEQGNRNPRTINLPELTEISKQAGGIPAFLSNNKPELFHKLSFLLPQDQNNPTKVLPLLDAHRRDLTINSIFYNVNTGKIEDFTKRGYADLATMTMDTPLEPSQTFTDDPLRILRVLRFYSKYPNGKIAPRVIEGMKDADAQFQLTRKIQNSTETQGIVVERSAIELRKIMQGQQPEAAIRIMYQTGLLGKMLNLPKQFHPLEMDQQNKWHSLNVVEHTLQVLKHVNNLSMEFKFDNEQRMMMNLSALFHDLGKLDPRSHKNKPDNTRGYSGNPDLPKHERASHQEASSEVWSNFAKALGLSTEENTFVHDLVSGHMRPHSHVEGQEESETEDTPDMGGLEVDDRKIAILRRYMRKNPNWVFQYVHAMADAMSKSTDSNEALTHP